MSDQIAPILAALDRVAVQIIQKVTLDVVANLKRAASEGGTPVDTGWARANWLISIGAPVTQPAGPPGQPNLAAQSAGEAAVLGYRKPNAPIYITNNVPYIGRLDAGWSQQAPAGFVSRAVEEAVRGVRGVGP